jgi:hypothetical protein
MSPMTEKSDQRDELKRRLEQARRMAAGANPLTQEQLAALIRDLEEQLR